MKKILFLLYLTVMSVTLYAQDRVVYTSGKVINVRVVEVAGSDVKFRMLDNLQGPILTEKLVNIYYIQYQDGRMHIFNGFPQRVNNYIPSQAYTPYTKPYTSLDLPPSGFTKQIDLYFQDAWGVGFMLRKEMNEYFGWNLIGASYMSGWNEVKSPEHYGQVNARLGGIRLYLPCVQNVRAYADVTLGYSFFYFNYPNLKRQTHFAGFDFSAGLQIHKNVALGYTLNLIVNGDGHATNHWGRVSLLF
jgi:hypothetical protein